MSNNTAIKPTILVFADLSRLWAFSRQLANQNQEINAATRLITCECSEADLERAVTQYGASQLEERRDHYKLNHHEKCN